MKIVDSISEIIDKLISCLKKLDPMFLPPLGGVIGCLIHLFLWYAKYSIIRDSVY